MLSRGKMMVELAVNQQCSGSDNNSNSSADPSGVDFDVAVVAQDIPEVQHQTHVDILQPTTSIATCLGANVVVESLSQYITPEIHNQLGVCILQTGTSGAMAEQDTSQNVIEEPIPGTSGIQPTTDPALLRCFKRNRNIARYNDLSDSDEDFSKGSSDDYDPHIDEAHQGDTDSEDSDCEGESQVVEAMENEPAYQQAETVRENAEGNPLPEGKKSRRRSRNPEKWKRKSAAISRARGEEYVSQNGMKIPAKTVNTDELCQCKLNCSNKFSIEERKTLFRNFYAMDINAKNAFLFRSIIPAPIKRKTLNTTKERSHSFKYCTTINGSQVNICKSAFCELFKIGRKKIELLQNKLKSGQSVPKPDMRGKHASRPHKLKDEVHQYIVEHISKFPSEASHYSIHVNPNRRYLSPLLTVKKMYELYLEQCAGKPDFIVKEPTYRHIFCTEFNLGFGEPRSDTCSRCDSGECGDDHIAFYKAAFEAQKRDKHNATNNRDLCFITMDMQQTMPLPKLSTSKAFYLRQVWLYNFGVHTVTDQGDKPFMFTWTEDVASRGSNEVASCVYYFTQLTREMLKDVNHLIILSDSCSGQNKNFNMIALYQYLILTKSFQVIDHKFPEIGHSYLDSDRDFGRIEKRLRKHEKICTPEQYRTIIKEASVKSASVHDMEHHFVNVEELPNQLQLINRKKNSENEKVNFRDSVKWIRVNEFGSYLYKTSYDQEAPFKRINILKRPDFIPKNPKLSAIRGKTGTLSQEKLENIKTQLPFIDIEHRWFYEQFFPETTQETKKKQMIDAAASQGSKKKLKNISSRKCEKKANK